MFRFVFRRLKTPGVISIDLSVLKFFGFLTTPFYSLKEAQQLVLKNTFSVLENPPALIFRRVGTS